MDEGREKDGRVEKPPEGEKEGEDRNAYHSNETINTWTDQLIRSKVIFNY